MPIFDQLPLFAFDPRREKARALRRAAAPFPGSTATWFRVVLPGVVVGRRSPGSERACSVSASTSIHLNHGCLVIRVAKSARLYRQVEGWWRGIVDGC